MSATRVEMFFCLSQQVFFSLLSLSVILTSRRSSPPALTKLVDLLLPPLISAFSFSFLLCCVVSSSPFKTRGRVFYGGEVCSAPMLGRTLFTFLVAITDPHNLPLATSPSFHYPRPPFLLLLMHVFLYPRSVYCKPNTM